nr:hypothetical protein [Streptococcus suis]
MGSPVAGVHRGLAPQMYDMPVVLVTLSSVYDGDVALELLTNSPM